MAAVYEQDNYHQWLAQINQVCGSFAGRLLPGAFYGQLETSYTQNLKLSTVSAGGVSLYRTRHEIKSGNDAWFYAVFQLEGESILEQDYRQTALGAGDITLIDAARPCSIYWPDASRQISLMLPRQLLEQHFRFQGPGCAQKLSHNLPTVQLSHHLLQESMTNAALSETESEAALEAMVCLLRPVLQQQEAAAPRKERLFRNVLSLIDDNIQSESLRPEWIAAESGMSVRSLYRMFADKGLVVAQYIRHRRLDLCAQMLCTARDDEKLAGIGYSWGFADHSHFSTAFKQRFGVSPGEYRKRHR